MLEVAFGKHVIAGDLAKSIVTGTDPTHVVKIQQILGEAFGKGWSGPTGVWFRGTVRDSSKYKFFPGVMSPSNADSTQGIDSVFTDDTPHSNTAWMRVECPNGSEVGIPDFDTKESPPTGFSGIFNCQLGDIYNSSGTVTSSGVLLTNPADVIAFGCKEIRRYDNSRIDWASLATLRSGCDATETPNYTTLPQGVGLTGSYYDGSGFTTLKSTRVDPVIQYDASTGAPELGLTATSFAVRWQGKIRFKYSETYTMTLVHNDSGKLWINNLSTPLIDQAASGTHTANFVATADQWYDIKIEWTNASGNSEFRLDWSSTSQTQQVVPQDRLYPYAASVPKFRTNIAFTQRTSFDEFLRRVLFSCNGGYQDANGVLKFFSYDDLTSSFSFTESNIVKNTFKFYPRFSQQELLQLPNRYVADGRDLDSRYLEKFDPPLYYDSPSLQDAAGRVIEETISIGNSTRWQALKNLAHHAKMKTQPLVAEFEGLPTTLQVLPGDKVTLTHSIPGWTNKSFICIEATDKAINSSADERSFKLLNWD